MGVLKAGQSLLEKALGVAVTQELDGTPYEFEFQPTLGGIRPDLLVHGPNGQTVAADIKWWRESGEVGSVNRAANHAAHLQRLTDADHAFVLLPGVRRNYRGKGVLAPDSFVEVLGDLFEDAPDSDPGPLAVRTAEARKIFAAMPFAPKYDDTYLVAMTEAALAQEAVCIRTDRYEFEGDIVEELKGQIHTSLAVFADLSELRPNVMFELGYAHGLEKIIIPISSTPLDLLPFDVRNWNVIEYAIGQTTALKGKLTKRLRSALKEPR